MTQYTNRGLQNREKETEFQKNAQKGNIENVADSV
jgi:hypothetical protein